MMNDPCVRKNMGHIPSHDLYKFVLEPSDDHDDHWYVFWGHKLIWADF